MWSAVQTREDASTSFRHCTRCIPSRVRGLRLLLRLGLWTNLRLQINSVRFPIVNFICGPNLISTTLTSGVQLTRPIVTRLVLVPNGKRWNLHVAQVPLLRRNVRPEEPMKAHIDVVNRVGRRDASLVRRTGVKVDAGLAGARRQCRQILFRALLLHTAGGDGIGVGRVVGCNLAEQVDGRVELDAGRAGNVVDVTRALGAPSRRVNLLATGVVIQRRHLEKAGHAKVVLGCAQELAVLRVRLARVGEVAEARRDHLLRIEALHVARCPPYAPEAVAAIFGRAYVAVDGRHEFVVEIEGQEDGQHHGRQDPEDEDERET
ncbi:hypothetical protein IWZ00DRAFT_561443 [Phyllosticta capitalensis]